jgi:hypothetical protein
MLMVSRFWNVDVDGTADTIADGRYINTPDFYYNCLLVVILLADCRSWGSTWTMVRLCTEFLPLAGIEPGTLGALACLTDASEKNGSCLVAFFPLC